MRDEFPKCSLYGKIPILREVLGEYRASYKVLAEHLFAYTRATIGAHNGHFSGEIASFEAKLSIDCINEHSRALVGLGDEKTRAEDVLLRKGIYGFAAYMSVHTAATGNVWAIVKEVASVGSGVATLYQMWLLANRAIGV